MRVSEPLDWDAAIEGWYEIDDVRRALARVPAESTAAHIPVWYFAVRHADDPDWPADAPLSTVRVEAVR